MNKNILSNFWLWLTLLVLLVVLIIVKIPANLAAFVFTKAVPGLSLAEIQGTFWRGTAGTALLNVNGDLYSLGKFDWRLKPLSLITMKPCSHVSFIYQNQTATGDVCGRDQRVDLTDFSVNLPATVLDMWVPASLSGELSMMIEEGTLIGNQVRQMTGNLSWRNGAYHDGANWINLGSFGGNLVEDQRGGVNLKLIDLGGPLIADLDINYNPGLRPNDEYGVALAGEIGVRDSAHRDLQQIVPTVLGTIGERSQRGYSFEWQQ
ncbi:type II secretion system protein N [Halioxenophilus aromaticivorans]|uniref:Type II secretion system protein N n=1 Tax=Halioxenophilus aromaticivorans TaxID=1306992 RepID=A0AAV3U5T2_9ALTE